ncbi:hypothetical protein [Hypericibacter sp.]|uniref:hypothetical protein n=1 Tax=Hypericibacter sp. TaxID=2705401 RepID=UPI003D6D3043
MIDRAMQLLIRRMIDFRPAAESSWPSRRPRWRPASFLYCRDRDTGHLALVALLIPFENFNTTLMLVGSDPPLTITMYDRMREGSTPVINAVFPFLMIGSGLLGLISVMAQRDRTAEKSS